MKNILFLGMGLCLFFSLQSCNNWLDVKPETEVEVDRMFKDQYGFQGALTGVYLKFKNASVYGGQLMYGTIEYLAQHWEVNTNENLKALSRYNYMDGSVQGSMSGIYSQLYAVIASANGILEQIDSKKDVFEPGMYEIIKGEALAIRAYCHLDLLRLFGPMPTQIKDGKILPYVKTVTIAYHDHHTYDEYVAFLKEDLAEAGRLLKQADPVLVEHEETKLSISATDFLKARQLRMNYYAVQGIQARFYLWLGGAENKAKAYAFAKEIKDAVDKYEKPRYTLGSSEEITNEDYAFSCEHISAIYDYNMYERVTRLFQESSAYIRNKNIVIPELYVAGTTDIRFTGLWTELTASNGTKSHVIKKFWQKDESGAINQMPLLRLAEIYLILIECSTLEEADEYYKEFCLSRDIPVVDLQDEMQVRSVLIEEYNKEFYGEGQAFYMYKRLAVEDILWAEDPGNEESYVVPLPQSEIKYE